MELFYNNHIKSTEVDLVIINFINKQTNTFLESTITELAKKLYISTSMLTKFSNKYGYSGYRKMQIEIAKEYGKYNYNDKELDINQEKIFNEISSHLKYAIDKTSKILQKQNIFAATSLINNAKHIFIFGNGSSQYAASNLNRKLSILEFYSQLVNNVNDIIIYGNKKQAEKTLMIIFSQSLESQGIKEIIKFCEKNNIFIIIITENELINVSNKKLVIKIKTMEKSERTAIKWFSPKILFLLISDTIIEVLKKNYKLIEKESFKK